MRIKESSTITLDQAEDIVNVQIDPGIEVSILEVGHHHEVKLDIRENSLVQYISVFSGPGDSTKQAQLHNNAACHWRTAIMGGDNYQAISTIHSGDGSNSDHMGIFLGTAKDRFAMNYWTHHTGKNTSGHIRVHGALFDTAYADFKGNIKIAQSGTDTDGSLTEETLLLGEHARSDSVPQLEIDTNAVQAAHSSSITRIDDEQLFYLQSRAVSKAEAKRMIVRGFLQSIIVEFNNDRIRKEINAIIEQRIQYV